jgi:serine O-acetyltransferase
MIFSDAFKADYYRMTGDTFRVDLRLLKNILLRHNVRYAFWLRRHLAAKDLFSRVMLYRYSRKFGLECSPNVTIGKGLLLGHPYNITIGDGVVIGDNLNIHKGATIGVENRGKRMGAPTIGNRVFIGINATIVGKITIGDDVMICPGAYVNFDVPSHSVVLGNPGIVHARENATELYVRNCV